MKFQHLFSFFSMLKLIQKCLYVLLHALILWTICIGCVFAEHFFHKSYAVLIGSKFVLCLNVMHCKATYLIFFLAPQHFAHAIKHGSHQPLEEIVAAHIEIGGLWGHSQPQKLGTERFVSLSPFWKTFLQTRNLLIDMVAQSFQRTLGVVVVELIDLQILQGSRDGELEIAEAVEPLRPDDGLVVLADML